MAPESIASRRVYRSELRARQAEETRARVIAAAAELFSADGYARTTLGKIAAAAGVSTETVQGQGSKAALMIAAVEYLSVGVAGEDNILNLDLGRRLQTATGVADFIDFGVDAIVAIHTGSAQLAGALIGAAGTDAELERYLGDLRASIRLQCSRVLEIYRDNGWVRSDVPFDELVETVAVLISVDNYLLITKHGGWSTDRYAAWLRRMLTETVFELA